MTRNEKGRIVGLVVSAVSLLFALPLLFYNNQEPGPWLVPQTVTLIASIVLVMAIVLEDM